MNTDTRARLVQASAMDKLARAGVLEIGRPAIPYHTDPGMVGGADLAAKLASGEIDKEAFLAALGGRAANALMRGGYRLGGVKATKGGIEFAKNVSKPAAAVGAKMRQLGTAAMKNPVAAGAITTGAVAAPLAFGAGRASKSNKPSS